MPPFPLRALRWAFAALPLLAGCATLPPPQNKPFIDETLQKAMNTEGLAVWADGCLFSRTLVVADRFVKDESIAIAQALQTSTVAALRSHSISERTHTAPLFCGMLINSVINDARYSDTRKSDAESGSPPYFAHPQIEAYPQALDAYLRLLRSVYGVVMQDGSAEQLPGIVALADAMAFGLATRSIDKSRKKEAQAAASANGVTAESASIVQTRLRARYVLMVSELQQDVSGGAKAGAPAFQVLTLGMGCLLARAGSDLCMTRGDSRFTAAALVDLQTRSILWQSSGQSLEGTLKSLLDG